jgi:meso-butanediol dehydrogenase / (S,S)-butanediol dehydrogenase / diacetyl reductase
VSAAARDAGRVVVITGGAGGIGSAMAAEFAALGDRVIVCDNRADNVTGSGDFETRHLDVADERSVDEVLGQIIDDHGTVDVLCNNAGIGCWTNLEDTSVEAWDHTMSVNIRGMFLCCRRAAPVMRNQGSGCIVNTASVHSFQSWAGCATYAASKGAVLAFTRAIAVELIPHGIRVNAIAPGTTDTPMVRLDDAGDPVPEAALAEEIGSIPIGRMATPAEIARVATFLASDSASFLVGSCVIVDGGTTAML